MPRLHHRLLHVARRLPGAPRIRRLIRTARQVPEAVRLVTDPEASQTFYPEAPRKEKREMLADHLRYLLRHGEVDTRYFMYGLDREGVKQDAVVEYPEFRRIRDRGHAARSLTRLSYACVLEDKYLFGQVAASFGVPSPRNLAVVDRGMVEWIEERERQPLESLLMRDLDGFCKPFNGISSRGAFALRVEDGAVSIDGTPSTQDDLRLRLNERYLVQERVLQHPSLDEIYPLSINTLRVHTVLEGDGARVFSTILRMGRAGRRFDGLGAGGVGVSVGVESGRLSSSGLVRTGGDTGWHDRHPDTGVKFDGVTLPHYEEAKALCCRLSELLPFFHTVGWDVAITPDGPLIIEGNDNWGATAGMSIEPDFRDRFLSLYH